MATLGSEDIRNIMPFGHAANAIELDDGSIFVVWYCGSYEGCEDQRIAGALRTPEGQWNTPDVLVNRFSFGDDTWVPEIGVPVPRSDNGLRLFFWATPLSSFRLLNNPGQIHLSGGSGGGSWFALPAISYEGVAWARDIGQSRVFVSELDRNLKAMPPQPFSAEGGLVLMGAARRLRSGRWMLPYHTERKDCWFHTRFFLSDEGQTHWVSRGDIFREPGCLEPVIVQFPTGEILSFMRRGGFDGHIWRVVSTDEFQTSSEPTQTNLRNPHAGIDLGLSRRSGRVLVAYNDSYRMRTPLTVGISHDGGQTFRTRDVEAAAGSFAYPKLLQDRQGLWHLFYSYNYRYIRHAWFDEAWVEQGRRVLG